MEQIALYLIATPIGNDEDLSPRATKILLHAQLVIGEEFRPLTTLLKRIGRPRQAIVPGQPPDLEVLNEHSRNENVQALADRVIEIHKSGGFTALVTDCGTPGFCDPGSSLVAELRQRGFRSTAIPGASSLMCLLSLAGQRLDEFTFRGFLPAEREAREVALESLVRENRATIVMDTPYRLEKLLHELAMKMGNRSALLTCDLTTEAEELHTGTLSDLAKAWANRPAEKKKAEFMLLIHAVQSPTLSKSESRSVAQSSKFVSPSKNSRVVNKAGQGIKGRVNTNEIKPFPRKK